MREGDRADRGVGCIAAIPQNVEGRRGRQRMRRRRHAVLRDRERAAHGNQVPTKIAARPRNTV